MSEETGTGIPEVAEARWPKVVGTIGVILGALMVLDQVDDLMITAMWSETDWSRLVGPEMAEFIVNALPASALGVSAALLAAGLGALLVVASVRIHRRQKAGVPLARTWAWLAIVWALIETGRAMWWLGKFGDTIPNAPREVWLGATLFGLGSALAVMVAFPIFLLVWFARPSVYAETATWQD